MIISTDYRCFACSEMQDNCSFHAFTASEEPYLRGSENYTKVCQMSLSTNITSDTEEKLETHLQVVSMSPEQSEESKVIIGEAICYDPKIQAEDQLTIPKKMPQSGRKAPGAPRKKGDSLKNFYPKLKTNIKSHSPLEPDFSICQTNRIQMLMLYGGVLQPFLLEISQYNRSPTQPTTDHKRKEENKKIWEKDEAKKLLKEYDKLCKER